MERIMMMEYLLHIKKNLKIEVPGQVTNTEIQEVYLALDSILDLCEDVEASPEFTYNLNKFAKALSDTSSQNVEVLPQSVKNVLGEMVVDMLTYLSRDIKEHYTENEFEVSPVVINVMREVVRINERSNF